MAAHVHVADMRFSTKDGTMTVNEVMNSGTSDQDAGTATEAAGGWLIEQTVTSMAADPAMGNMLSALQDDACATLSAIIDKTAALLMKNTESSLAERPRAPLTVQQGAGLALESKRREQAWRQARECAEMLVIGALINKDNPDWDPANPSTCAKDGQGALLSLIRFDQDGTGARES
jgi:hypothetical protein